MMTLFLVAVSLIICGFGFIVLSVFMTYLARSPIDEKEYKQAENEYMRRYMERVNP